LSVFIQSDVLFLKNGHRLQNIACWYQKWNGNDTLLVMPTISKLWFLTIKPENMSNVFFKHSSSLLEDKKEWIYTKFGLNITNSKNSK
jgi:hypothetical protein